VRRSGFQERPESRRSLNRRGGTAASKHINNFQIVVQMNPLIVKYSFTLIQNGLFKFLSFDRGPADVTGTRGG
jgi:hypothetical protein